ncbi:MAG: hypothetical protein HY905_09745 [Deltaproteobacteria bacterium]|nr:hypothetical protein [Deltaproteobacteria bacterium]
MALLAGLLVAAPAARAAAAVDDAAAAIAVLVVPAADGDAPTALVAAIQAHLADVGADLVVERVESFPASLPAQVALAAEVAERTAVGAVFWFDLSLPEHVFVYVCEGEGSRVLVRAVGAADEAERIESVAIIVRSLTRAILAGGTLGVELATPPAAEPVGAVEVPAVGPAGAGPGPTAAPGEILTPATGDGPSATPPDPAGGRQDSSPWLALQVGVALDFFSEQAPVQEGMSTGVAFRVHENWSIFAAYRILTDVSVSGGGVDLDVSRHPMELGARFRWPLGDWALGASVSGVFDFLTRRATVRTSSMTARVPEDAWIGGVGVLVHGSLRLGGPWRVFLDGGFDAFVGNVRYAADTGTGRVVLLESWFVCPRLSLGFAVDLLS